MTDRGSRARWTAAALVAPTAAALFAGTTAWAAGHQPETGATKPAPTATPTPTVDPIVEELQAAVDANTAQVAQLRATVAALKAQAAAIAKGTPAKASSSKGSSSASSRTAPRRTTTTKKTTTVKKTAPAPSTQTSTGASGA